MIRPAQQPLAPEDRVRLSLDQLIRLHGKARSLRLAGQRRSARRQGGHRSMQRGRGMSLAEVRPYQPGDDVRRIDWRVTARTREPHTKIYEEERERPVLLICDLGPSLFFASEGAYKQVRAAEASALLAWLALGSGDQIGGVIVNQEGVDVIRPARRKQTVLRLLASLAARQQYHAPKPQAPDPSRSSLDHALHEARPIAHTGSRIFVISDFSRWSDVTASHLGNLARHNAVTALEITDPLDLAPPAPGQYRIATPEGPITLDTSDPRVAAGWRQQAEWRQAAKAELFRNAGVEHLRLMTGEEPDATLAGFTGAGGRLR